MKKKMFKISAALLIIVLLCMQIHTFYKNSDAQYKVDHRFMGSYTNLTLNLLNKTCTDDINGLHRLDIENTKHSYTMTSLYSRTSFYKDSYVDNIIATLNYVSGCDAVYEINLTKELYDLLKEFGYHINNDTCTEAISKATWEALEKAVNFDKVKSQNSYTAN